MPPLDETETGAGQEPEDETGGQPEGEGEGQALLPNSVSIRERIQYAQKELDRIDALRDDLTDERNDLISGLKEHGVDVVALRVARKIKRDFGDQQYDAAAHADNIVEYLEYLYPQREMDV